MVKFFLSAIKRPACSQGIQSFLALWAVSRLWGLSAGSIFCPLLFLLFWIFFGHVYRLTDGQPSMAMPGRNASGTPAVFSEGRLRLLKACMALFFALLCLLARHGSLTHGLEHPLFAGSLLLLCGMGFYLIFYHALGFLFHHAMACTLAKEEAPLRQLPLLTLLACLGCWMLYFLTEYPAIMTPDSVNQLEQVLGMVPYSNHHPWAHTMLIGFFYRLGTLFTGNVNGALAFFTLFQMCFMASCAAYLIHVLQRLKVSNQLCLLAAAFYALIPYHGILAVTIWKDVMFSGAVLLFTASLTALRLIGIQSRLQKWLHGTIYVLSGIMVCLFRSNGWYAFLFSLPFLLFSFRKQIKGMLPVHLGILAAVLFIKIPVMNAFQVTQPDFVESVSIPLQQIARVLCQDKELTREQWESIHRVMDTTYIKELYSPGFADNMKELVRAGDPDYLAGHKGEYLRLWLCLGLRYPGVYLQAYIDQTIGYWYPDPDYTVARVGGIIANDTGAVSQPLAGGPALVKIKEILLKLDELIPLYGLLFSMGAMLWALLCCIAISVSKGTKERLILFLPGLAVILTLLAATPVSSEFRYAYSLAFALPLYLLLPFFPSSR